MSYGELPIRYVRTFEAGGKSIRSDYYNPPPDVVSYTIEKRGDKIIAKNGRTGQIEFSGTDAATVIQSAINSLTNGGKIFVKKGLYIVKESIIIDQSNIIFQGEGWGTIFKRVGQSLDDSIICVGKNKAGVGARVDNVIVADLQVDGNKGAGVTTPVNCKGVFVCPKDYVPLDKSTYNHDCVVINVYAHDCGSEGISFDFNVRGAVIKCKCENNDWYDIAMYRSFDCLVADNYVSGGGGGLNLDSLAYSIIANNRIENLNEGYAMTCATAVENEPFIYNMIISNHIITVPHYGIYLREASRNIIANNIFNETRSHAILLHGSSRNLVIANVIRNPSYQTNNWACGIRLATYNTSNSIRNMIIGNVIVSEGEYRMKAGISEADANQDYNHVTLNQIEGAVTAPIEKHGEHTIVKLNQGFATENSGTATMPAGATSVSIEHGLAGTPTVVTLGAKGNLGALWWTANSTHITIYCSSAPTSDTDITWYAEYKP